MHSICLFFVAILVAITGGIAPAFAGDVAADQPRHYRDLMDKAAASARRAGDPQVGSGSVPGLSRDQINQMFDSASAQAGYGGGGVSRTIDDAYMRQKQGTIRNTAPASAARAAANQAADTVDPAELARLYRGTVAQGGADAAPKDELIVFVSTSIPPETLRVIGMQARRYGAVLALRGVPGGFSGRNLREMIRIMKPAIDQGADVQIHPELFKRYGITAVPTTVLSTMHGKGCDEGFCTNHVSLVGDVSVEYALEQFARRRDELGRIAEQRLAGAKERP